MDIIYYLAAAVLGFLGGQAAVYVFNRLPAVWLCDYDEKPDEELLHPTHQRIPSTPWKLILSALLIVVGIRCVSIDPLYGLAAIVLTWILIEISIADIKYRIIPDQFTIMTGACGLGFLNFHGGASFAGIAIPVPWMDLASGLLAGGLLMILVALLGKAFVGSGESALGMGDVKLMAALGACLGLRGIVWVFCVATLMAAMVGIVLLVVKSAEKDKGIPFALCIGVAAVLYLAVIV